MMINKVLLSLFALVLCISLNSCDKFNQVDNSNTVKVPYVLYAGGYDGTLYQTNDALYFNMVFPPDFSVVRHIATADSNLLYVKQKAYYSKNEGKAFVECANTSPTYDFVDQFYKYYIPNGMLYQTSSKKVFLCTKNGLAESVDFGKSFNNVGNWADPAIIPNSIIRLNNDDLFIIKDSSTNVYRLAPGTTSNWTKIVPVKPLPTDTTTWYLASQGDTIYAIDYTGQLGVFASNDFGVNWVPTTGLPNGHKILFGNTPAGYNNLFVGYDSLGMYRLKGYAFEQVGNGIPWWAKVSYMVGKQTIYRSDIVKKYIFCATNIGLYVSENNGTDWRLVKAGNFSTLQ